MIQKTWKSRDGLRTVIVEGSTAAVAAGFAELDAAQSMEALPTTNRVTIRPLIAPTVKSGSALRVVKSGAFPDHSPPEPRPSYYGAAASATTRRRRGTGPGEPLCAPVLQFQSRKPAEPPTVEKATRHTAKVTPLSVPKLQF